MCCGLQTHTIIISVIGIIFSGLVYLSWNLTGLLETEEVNFSGIRLAQYVWSATNLIANVLCLTGAIKCKKCFLVPYIIVNSIWITLLISSALLLFIFGSLLAGGSITEAIGKEKDISENGAHWLGLGLAIHFVIILIPVSIILGLYVYFLVIVIKFYKEISSARISDHPTRIVLQPYSTNQYINQQAVNVTSDDLISTYPHEQPPPYTYRQPPTNPFTQQERAYEENKY